MRHLYKLFALLCILLLSASKIQAQANTQDSLAIVDIYNSTNGANWSIKTNWLTTAPLSTWYGITVSVGRVISVDLFSNNLKGNIPSSIGNLTKLSFDIRLEKNQLTGTIPTSIGNLVLVTQINLSGNQLSGAIPNELSNLTKLTYLDMSFNALSGNIPSALGNLSQLGRLFLNANKLTGPIPTSIGSLNKLLYCYLDFNQLSGSIPSTVNGLSSLITLSLGNNNLSGKLPIELGTLSKLSTLDVSSNQLSDTIPASIGSLSNLSNLKLQFNQLSGSIPASFDSLYKITTLLLNNNQLSGKIPNGLSTIPTLTNLSLNNNQFTFSGMEAIASKAIYAPQAIIKLIKQGIQLSVSVGGTPSNDTFRWYNGAALIATVIGDSSFTPAANGKYWVSVTNAIATKLTLRSDTFLFSALPIESIILKVTTKNNKNLLEWQSINETSTIDYYIESSDDTRNFTPISVLKAKGIGNNTYRAEDIRPIFNSNNSIYYRIKAVSANQLALYSQTAKATIASFTNSPLALYPNPAKNQITISQNNIQQVNIYTLTGKLIKTISYQSAPPQPTTLYISDLLPAVYQLQIISNQPATITKFSFIKL